MTAAELEALYARRPGLRALTERFGWPVETALAVATEVLAAESAPPDVGPRLEELRAALEPFARFGAATRRYRFGDGRRLAVPPGFLEPELRITVGHCRRAAEVYFRGEGPS